MQSRVPHFSLSALEAISKLIAESYSGTGITEFFRKAGFTHIRHDGSTKWEFVSHALEAVQKSQGGDASVAKIVEALCNPQEFFGKPKEHLQMVERVEEIVNFYDLSVDHRTGKLKITEGADAKLRSHISKDAEAFDVRRFHSEVVKHGRELFVESRYFHAVFECCKAFDRFVANKAQLPNEHGDRLMGAAMSLSGPLKLNTQRTLSEKNEQEGIMHLCKGLMSAIRNPEAHQPSLDWHVSQQDALDILTLISFLYRKVDAAIYFK